MPSIGSRSLRREKERRRSTLDPSTFSPSRSRQAASDGALSISQEPAVRAASEDGPRSEEPASSRRRMSAIFDTKAPPVAPVQDVSSAPSSRFNLLRFRNASEPQLGAKAREQASQAAPPVPAVPVQTPAIIMTAPTMDGSDQTDSTSTRRTRSRFQPFSRQKQAAGPIVLEPAHGGPSEEIKEKAEKRKSRFGTLRAGRGHSEDARKVADGRRSADILTQNGQKASSSLALPLPRHSESSKCDGESPERDTNSSLMERQLAPRSHATFNWLPRKSKNRHSLFPLPVRIPPPDENTGGDIPSTPRASTGARSSISPEHSPANSSPTRGALKSSIRTTSDGLPNTLLPHTLPYPAIDFALPGPLLRTGSVHSVQSSRSSPAAAGELLRRGRMRSSTLSSTGGLSDEAPPPTPPFAAGGPSGRNSTSTAGRSSFSNLFGLNRFRHSSDPHSPRQGSPGYGLSAASGAGSHSNSLNLSREAISLPERQEGETALQYLARVEEVVPKSQIPAVLSKSDDEFQRNVMRSFMRKFAFFGDPLDMAIRMLLLEVDLPKETQQIDRVLQGFADRYHECNPGIFGSAENAYFIAFSILILQTDAFNKNNKRKMTKQDYIKNSSIDGLAEDVLECFYDNTVYTPFIRVEEEDDVKTMHSKRHRRPVRAIKHVMPEPVRPKASKEPLDPYTLIFESKLDTLRPPIREVMNLEDPYSYLGTSPNLDASSLKVTKIGILQIESSRSRPDAFMSPSGIENPEEAKAGIVELPVDKVGVIWRKDPKKKTARSPWQEWGAILCGAGLYFFKNHGWVKSLLHQYEHHIRHGHQGTPCTFTPAIQQFKPDYMLPTDHGVALQDNNYKRHKNAFVFFRPSGSEEVFLADSEAEKNDWISKLNHQAAFKTANIRQRGLVGGHYDGQRQRGLRRLESANSTSTVQTVQTPTGEVTIQSGKIDHQLAQQISLARQENMRIKIEEAEERLDVVTKQIEALLRDARHLLILAPIQSKTREQLVLAAGRMAAKLKWIRIEMWRMKCHRDILTLDLEEEKKESQKRQARLEKSALKTTSITSHSSTSTVRPKQAGAEVLSPGAANVPITGRAPQSPTISTRPETKSSETSKDTEVEEDVFKTPPENSPTVTPTRFSLNEPLTIKPPPHDRNSLLSPRSPHLTGQDGDEPLASPSYSEYKTPMLDDEEAEQRREGGTFETPSDTVDGATAPPKADAATDSEADVDKPQPLTGSPDSRAKVRRSLQRTLREGTPHRESAGSHRSHHSYHRTRRSKNGSTSSAGVDEAAGKADKEGALESEVMLKRQKGSFTVHGKKASVITFGPEWANMPEERLKLIKQSQAVATDSANKANKSVDRDSAIVDDDANFIVHPFGSRSTSQAPRSSSFSSAPTRERQSSISSIASSGPNGVATNGVRKHSSSFSNSHGSPIAEAELFNIPTNNSNLSLRERRAAARAASLTAVSPRTAGPPNGLPEASRTPYEPHAHANSAAGDERMLDAGLERLESAKQQAVES